MLRHYRVTIDYPVRVMYWRQQSDGDRCDLCEVGLTLRSEGSAIFVAAVATRSGPPSVERVMPGDTLVRIGNLDLATARKGAIYDALHGKPGETRLLTLERDGSRFTVNAPVSAFYPPVANVRFEHADTRRLSQGRRNVPTSPVRLLVTPLGLAATLDPQLKLPHAITSLVVLVVA